MNNYDKELYNHNKNQKQAAKKYNIFICTLMAILILMIFGILYKFNSTKRNNIKYFNQNKQQLVNSNNIKQKQIDDYNIKLEKLKTKFQETNELLVLEGTTDVTCTYDNSNVLNSKDDNLSFLHKKFNELKIREIKVQTTYNFGFTYSLSNLNIIHNSGTNQCSLVLSDHNLKLKYIEENKDKTILTDSINLLAKKFTPQEINAITYRTKIGALNSVQSNEDIRLKAMNCAKINIEQFAEELGIKIDVDIKLQGLCENNEINIKEIGYKEN